MTDSTNLIRLIKEIQPDEIYNLAAMSHVAVSFETPEYTANTDGLGTLRVLDAIRLLGLEKKPKFIKPLLRNFMEKYKKFLKLKQLRFILGGNARTKAKNDLQSTCQGHIHTMAFTEWFCGANFKILAMQIGCGVNNKSYAAAYAKHFKKQAIGCGVILG